MADKVDGRAEFIARSAPLKEITKTVDKNVLLVTGQLKKGEITPGAGQLRLCQESLYGVSCYLGINRLALDLTGMRSTDAINSARKMLYNALTALEKVLPAQLDITGKGNQIPEENNLGLNVEERYHLIQKFALAIQMMIDAYEDKQIRLTFLDMEGRFAKVALNSLDMRTAIKSYMAMDEDYNLLCHFFPLQERLLFQSAANYRARYEQTLGTDAEAESDDLNLGIRYLEAVVHLANLIRDPEAAEYKKKLDLWEGKRSEGGER
jgi:hypothetical protein